MMKSKQEGHKSTLSTYSRVSVVHDGINLADDLNGERCLTEHGLNDIKGTFLEKSGRLSKISVKDWRFDVVMRARELSMQNTKLKTRLIKARSEASSLAEALVAANDRMVELTMESTRLKMHMHDVQPNINIPLKVKGSPEAQLEKLEFPQQRKVLGLSVSSANIPQVTAAAERLSLQKKRTHHLSWICENSKKRLTGDENWPSLKRIASSSVHQYSGWKTDEKAARNVDLKTSHAETIEDLRVQLRNAESELRCNQDSNQLEVTKLKAEAKKLKEKFREQKASLICAQKSEKLSLLRAEQCSADASQISETLRSKEVELNTLRLRGDGLEVENGGLTQELEVLRDEFSIGRDAEEAMSCKLKILETSLSTIQKEMRCERKCRKRVEEKGKVERKALQLKLDQANERATTLEGELERTHTEIEKGASKYKQQQKAAAVSVHPALSHVGRRVPLSMTTRNGAALKENNPTSILALATQSVAEKDIRRDVDVMEHSNVEKDGSAIAVNVKRKGLSRRSSLMEALRVEQRSVIDLKNEISQLNATAHRCEMVHSSELVTLQSNLDTEKKRNETLTDKISNLQSYLNNEKARTQELTDEISMLHSTAVSTIEMSSPYASSLEVKEMRLAIHKENACARELMDGNADFSSDLETLILLYANDSKKTISQVKELAAFLPYAEALRLSLIKAKVHEGMLVCTLDKEKDQREKLAGEMSRLQSSALEKVSMLDMEALRSRLDEEKSRVKEFISSLDAEKVESERLRKENVAIRFLNSEHAEGERLRDEFSTTLRVGSVVTDVETVPLSAMEKLQSSLDVEKAQTHEIMSALDAEKIRSKNLTAELSLLRSSATVEMVPLSDVQVLKTSLHEEQCHTQELMKENATQSLAAQEMSKELEVVSQRLVEARTFIKSAGIGIISPITMEILPIVNNKHLHRPPSPYADVMTSEFDLSRLLDENRRLCKFGKQTVKRLQDAVAVQASSSSSSSIKATDNMSGGLSAITDTTVVPSLRCKLVDMTGKIERTSHEMVLNGADRESAMKEHMNQVVLLENMLAVKEDSLKCAEKTGNDLKARETLLKEELAVRSAEVTRLQEKVIDIKADASALTDCLEVEISSLKNELSLALKGSKQAHKHHAEATKSLNEAISSKAELEASISLLNESIGLKLGEHKAVYQQKSTGLYEDHALMGAHLKNAMITLRALIEKKGELVCHLRREAFISDAETASITAKWERSASWMKEELVFKSLEMEQLQMALEIARSETTSCCVDMEREIMDLKETQTFMTTEKKELILSIGRLEYACEEQSELMKMVREDARHAESEAKLNQMMLEDEIELLRNLLKIKEAEIKTALQKVATFETQAGNERSKLELSIALLKHEMEDRTDELQRFRNGFSNAVSIAESTNSELERENSSLKNEIDLMKDELDHNTAFLSEKLSSRLDEVKQLQQSLDLTNDELDHDRSFLKGALLSKSEEIKKLQEDLENAQQGAASGRIQMKIQLHEKEKSLTDVLNANKELATEVTSLNVCLAERSKEANEAESRQKMVIASLEWLLSEEQKNDRYNRTRLENELAEQHNEELEMLRDERDHAHDTELGEREAEIVSLNNTIDSKTCELEKLKLGIVEREDEAVLTRRILEEKIISLQDRLDSQMDEVERMRRTIVFSNTEAGLGQKELEMKVSFLENSLRLSLEKLERTQQQPHRQKTPPFPPPRLSFQEKLEWTQQWQQPLSIGVDEPLVTDVKIDPPLKAKPPVNVIFTEEKMGKRGMMNRTAEMLDVRVTAASSVLNERRTQKDMEYSVSRLRNDGDGVLEEEGCRTSMNLTEPDFSFGLSSSTEEYSEIKDVEESALELPPLSSPVFTTTMSAGLERQPSVSSPPESKNNAQDNSGRTLFVHHMKDQPPEEETLGFFRVNQQQLINEQRQQRQQCIIDEISSDYEIAEVMSCSGSPLDSCELRLFEPEFVTESSHDDETECISPLFRSESGRDEEETGGQQYWKDGAVHLSKTTSPCSLSPHWKSSRAWRKKLHSMFRVWGLFSTKSTNSDNSSVYFSTASEDDTMDGDEGLICGDDLQSEDGSNIHDNNPEYSGGETRKSERVEIENEGGDGRLPAITSLREPQLKRRKSGIVYDQDTSSEAVLSTTTEVVQSPDPLSPYTYTTEAAGDQSSAIIDIESIRPGWDAVLKQLKQMKMPEPVCFPYWELGF